MFFQSNVNGRPLNSNDTTSPVVHPPSQPARTLQRDGSLSPGSALATHRTRYVGQGNSTQDDATSVSGIPLEQVPRCKNLWFEDGDVIIWAQDGDNSLLYRVHRHVLKESEAEPLCTVVNCTYPNPKTSNEIFFDGVWVLKYAQQAPFDIEYLLKWMYERPSISKRSSIPFHALAIYLKRSEIHFIPAMRRCALEYLWNLLPTSLSYHQRIPTLVEDCYSENPTLYYKPYVLILLLYYSSKYRLVAILPLLYYYIAQWPVEWIIYGVPYSCLGDGAFHSQGDKRFSLPRQEATTALAGRGKLIRMRETRVFNFMEGFTSSGVKLDRPTPGCDTAKREETGETCFEWLMRVWFSMSCSGFIARPSALEIMNMGQWAELQKNCCEACAKRVMEHMLSGRDDVWEAIPGAFGYHSWDTVIKEQRAVEEGFEAEIS